MRSARTGIAVAGLLALMSAPGYGCAPEPAAAPGDALDRHRSAIMALPGVTGVGLGRCNAAACIRVFVARDAPGLAESLTRLLGDTPYEIVTSGEFRALPDGDG